MKARLTISRGTSRDQPRGVILIRLEDDLSSMGRVEVEMPLDSFAQAITGLGCVPVEAEWIRLDTVGLKMEVKQETIPWSPMHLTGKLNKEVERRGLMSAIKSLEVDGWEADNHPASDYSSRGYRVTFRRYVQPMTMVGTEAKE